MAHPQRKGRFFHREKFDFPKMGEVNPKHVNLERCPIHQGAAGILTALGGELMAANAALLSSTRIPP